MSYAVYIIYLNICLIYSYITVGEYWEAIKLKNGNFIIFSKNGLYILDPAFQILNHTTEIKMEDNFYSAIKQFTKEDEDYILIITFNNHYILDSYGNILYTNIERTLFDKWSSSIIPYNHLKDKFYYYIVHFKNQNQIIFKQYSYNFTNKTLQTKDFYFNNTYGNEDMFITCQLMRYSNENVISCFFNNLINNENFINCTVFKPEKNFEVIQTSKLKIEGIKYFSIISEVMSTDDRQKVLILFITDDFKNIFYAGYDIQPNNFTYGYLIQNNTNIIVIETVYFDISYFKETEEFIVTYYCINFDGQKYYNIYSFDKNFEYSFLGMLSDLELGDSCCKANLDLTFYSFFTFHLIFFSSIAQKYCIISNINYLEIISLFIINKEIKIINPTEIKSSDSPPEFICENYSIYNNTNCTNNLSLINDFKKLLEKNYLEKCTIEIDYITSNFTCDNYYYKKFEFLFSCSEEYPYEIVEINQCVKYCDEKSLSNGKCKLNYNSSHINSITENLNDIDSYKEINNQSDVFSTEIKYKDITTYSTDTILETRNIESDNISSDVYLITNSIDFSTDNPTMSKLTPTNKFEIVTNSYEVINNQSNTISTENGNCLITNSTEFISQSQKIDITIPTNISEILKDIYKLLNEILKEKKDNNINLIENMQYFFSDDSINKKLDNIVNGDKDITIISNNEIIIQITSTDNQRSNKNHNISIINLGICEETLKNEYIIDHKKPLLILKIDSFIVGYKIPVIQYEVYHPENHSKLNLSLCHNKIEINIHVSIDENNLYKHEQESDYYNNRCFTHTSENGKDMPLGHRRKEFINNNMTLCEAECDYKGYNYKTKNSKCECELKNEISIFNIKIDTQRLYNKFKGLNSSNIDIIKCYYLLFKKENYISNIGFYINLFIIFFFCIDALILIFKEYDLLVQKINIVIYITKKTSNILDDDSLISKKKNKRIKNPKKRKRKNNMNKKDNSQIKKENKDEIKRNNEVSLSNEEKSIQILKYGNNKFMKKNINNEKVKINKDFKRTKNSKLIIDAPYSKTNSLNNSKRYLNDYELNRLKYKEAIKYDKRNYIQYYWSLIKTGNLILFSFVPNNDYNSKVIKFYLFFFSFSLYYAVNTLFYTDSTMNKIYEDYVDYDFIYQIPKILYSNLICLVINLIIRILSLSEKDILKIKKKENNKNLNQKVENIKKCLKIKFVFYYLISFLFLLIFWFYISSFCIVYKNTQIYLIKDTLISFSLSLLYPLGFYLLPALFRLVALRNNNNECVYKISLFLQLF